MRKRDLGMRLMAMHLDSGRTSSLLRMITQVLLQFVDTSADSMVECADAS